MLTSSVFLETSIPNIASITVLSFPLVQGTKISPRPPHRSRRALLTHRAPPSGRTFGEERLIPTFSPLLKHNQNSCRAADWCEGDKVERLRRASGQSPTQSAFLPRGPTFSRAISDPAAPARRPPPMYQRVPMSVLSIRSKRSPAIDTVSRIPTSSSSFAMACASRSCAPYPMRRTVARNRSARKIASAR
jgi:hypothetical protein